LGLAVGLAPPNPRGYFDVSGTAGSPSDVCRPSAAQTRPVEVIAHGRIQPLTFSRELCRGDGEAARLRTPMRRLRLAAT
jgi:hypothetical protein